MTTVTYQCPNCGAGLAFDAEKQLFACEFCLSEFPEADLEGKDTEEARRAEEEAARAYNEGMNEYECPSCGAHVVSDLNTAATECYYCHNPVVLLGRLSGQMRPHRIIPFKYDKAEAEKRFLKFASKKWFVPRDFFAQSQVEKIAGVYYPFWITDADTTGTLYAHATRLRVWRVGNVEYTETSKFDIHRSGEIHFEDITTSALSEADKKMLEGVLPYPSEALQEFSAPYLSGYLAKKRNVEREQLSQEVRNRMNGYSRQLLRNTVQGYNTVTVKDSELNIQQSHWEYSLLPLWILTYQGKDGKTYTYAMNGHTGKVYGELPISFARLGILLASIAIPLTAFLTLLGGMLF
ncbi:MAG: TFIIB-type zinc ribbon-containing protein [Clostridia bacterium]|nr:TFIIB-type zinc ribbon-containing protein [Clostridia bacterium]